MKLRLKQRNNASFFLIAAIKLNKRFISICLASESPLANFRVAASLRGQGDSSGRDWGLGFRDLRASGHPVGWPQGTLYWGAAGKTFLKKTK